MSEADAIIEVQRPSLPYGFARKFGVVIDRMDGEAVGVHVDLSLADLDLGAIDQRSRSTRITTARATASGCR